jgi:glutathione S-transferase
VSPAALSIDYHRNSFDCALSSASSSGQRGSAFMILIGQYDSPFVRRAGIAMTLYGMQFEHKPWSTFGDADKIRRYNQLTRVPTLVLDDGEVLIDSTIILDHLDSLVPAERRMFPAAEPARRRALKVATLAVHTAEKAVSLFYEKVLHRGTASDVWTNRCRVQISGGLSALEPDRAARKSSYWFGEAIGHADIAVACALRFIADAHPGIIDMANSPALNAHWKRCEALPVFRAIQQTFIPPA